MTRRGLLVLGVSLALLPLGVALNHLTLSLFGAAGVAWVIAAWHSVSRSDATATRQTKATWLPEGSRIRFEFEVQGGSGHQRIQARQPIPQGILLHGEARVDEVIGPEDSIEASFELELPLRGLYTMPPIEVRASDPFELVERVIEADTESLTFTVIPQRVRSRRPLGRPRHSLLRPGEFMSTRAGSGSEFYSIREYMPSDALRLINWKASARNNEFMVNQFHDERVTQTVAIVDHRLRTGLGTFRHAPIHEIARGAAMAYQSAFEGGDAFLGMFLGEGAETIDGDGSRAFTTRMMGRLAEIEAEGAVPLEFAVRDHLHAIKQGARVIVLSPLAYEGDFEGLVLLAARECAVTVVVPPLPEPLDEVQAAWKEQSEENVKKARGLDVHVVETPLGLREHAIGEGLRV